MWTLAWDTHAFTHQPFAIFDANIYYPYARTLAYSENLIGSGLLAAPILIFTLQAVTSGHGAVFLLVATLALLAYRTALGEPLQLTKRFRDLGVTGALLLAPAVLVVLPYRHVQLEMGLRRGLENWVPTTPSFLASPTHVQTWLLSLVPEWRINEQASAFLFPGFLPLLLAALAFAGRRRHTRSPAPRDTLRVSDH